MPEFPTISPDKWLRVRALFESLVEHEEESLLASEPDPEIAAAVRRLLRLHKEAATREFLAQPITLVRDLPAAPL